MHHSRGEGEWRRRRQRRLVGKNACLVVVPAAGAASHVCVGAHVEIIIGKMWNKQSQFWLDGYLSVGRTLFTLAQFGIKTIKITY